MLLMQAFAAMEPNLAFAEKSKESSASNSTSKPPAKESSHIESDSNNPDHADDSSESTSTAKDDSAESPVTPETLPGKMTAIISPYLKSASWGVKVTNPANGQTLFEHNANNGFIPASNRKLFTGALALDQLGPNFVFRTYLHYTGKVDKAAAAINGNIVITPSGDPTFSTTLYAAGNSDWVFRDWAKKIQAAGIKTITGDLIVDCSSWNMNDINPRGWANRVTDANYAPQTSALTLNNNLVNIIAEPGKPGTPAKISFNPPATGYPVINNTVSGKPGGSSASRVGGNITIKGNINSRKIFTIPMDKPTLFAAANFRHHLLASGININGQIRIITSKNSIPPYTNENLIAIVESPKITEIINYMMKKSDNHFAEQLYVAVSAAKTGNGSYGASKILENNLLQRAGINPQAVQCYDGSGLSETNRITPSDICKLLEFMLKHPFHKEYMDSMAVGGRDGTLRGRMRNIEGRVHAKTGTINKVKTLSGYVQVSASNIVCFSFLVNDIKGSSPQSVHDRLCTLLTKLIL